MVFRSLSTLRGRLTLTYALALAVGLSVFVGVSLGIIDQTMKSTLDLRMATAARAIAATLNLATVRTPLDARTRSRAISLLGVLQQGAVVFRSGSIALESSMIPPSVLGVAHAQPAGRLTYTTVVAGDEPLRVAVVPLSNRNLPGAVVLVWRSMDFVSDYERTAGIIFGATMLFVLVCASFIGNLLARRALAPLRAAAAIASEIEAHDLSRRLAVPRANDELGMLTSTLNRMFGRLEGAFARQKQFTADASHDLRAPLSVMCAELDLALQRCPASSKYREAFVSIRHEALELERLLEELLRAARADATSGSREQTDLAPTIGIAIQRIAVFASARSVRVWQDLAADRFVAGEPELIERVFLSLLHNAVKYAPPGGNVWVSTRVTPTEVTCSIRDDGPGFTPDGLVHAFDRFWRDDAARSGEGSGLGLTIARTVVERFHGEIKIDNAPEGGAVVALSWPLDAPSETKRRSDVPALQRAR